VIGVRLPPPLCNEADIILDWGAKCGFFFLGTNAISWTYCYFRLPESKGRVCLHIIIRDQTDLQTYGELDVLFANGVSARKFSTTTVAEFETPLGKGAEVVNEKMEEKPEITHVELK